MPSPLSTGEILRAAAARVREGWIQGAYYDLLTGHVCAIGAVCAARGCTMADGEAQRLAVVNLEACSREVRLLVRALGLNDYVAAWNDAPDQTAENVATGLELAANLADEEDALKLIPPLSWTHRPAPAPETVDA